MYAIFNSDKNFISYADQKMEYPFLCKEILPENSNILEWRWNGNYDDGEMVQIKQIPYENVFNENYFNNKYPFDRFVSIVLKQLFITSKQNKTCQIEFEEMVKDYIHSFETNDVYINLLKLSNKKTNEK